MRAEIEVCYRCKWVPLQIQNWVVLSPMNVVIFIEILASVNVFKSLVVSGSDLWRLQLCVSVQNSTQFYRGFLQCVLCVSVQHLPKQHTAIQQQYFNIHNASVKYSLLVCQ